MNHWNCRLEISVIKADRNLAATAEVTFQMRFSGAFPPHGGGETSNELVYKKQEEEASASELAWGCGIRDDKTI